MTTGEKLSYLSSVSNVSALDHLLNIHFRTEFVDFVNAEVVEEIYEAKVVDTLLGSIVNEEVLVATLIEGNPTATIVEEINQGEIQC